MVVDRGCNVWPMVWITCVPQLYLFKAKAGTYEQLRGYYLSQLEAGMFDLNVPNVLMVTARGWYV